MLIEVRLSNMFSIKDEIVLDMRSGGSKSRNAASLASNCFSYNDMELMKSVAIYGANASGKSNLVAVFAFMKTVLTEGLPLTSVKHLISLRKEHFPYLPESVYMTASIR